MLWTPDEDCFLAWLCLPVCAHVINLELNQKQRKDSLACHYDWLRAATMPVWRLLSSGRVTARISPHFSKRIAQGGKIQR